MSPSTVTTQKWALDCYALRDAYTDFILSRQAMMCSPATMTFYNYTAGYFVTWLASQDVHSPAEISARHVRAYLAELIGRGLGSWTVNDYARAIRALLRFWEAEKYIPEPVKFAMPRIERRRLPVLTAEEVVKVLAVCDVREKAVFELMVDTGLRRGELVACNWGDLDMTTGLLKVVRGKGGKARSVVAGATTRRALLAYRRTLEGVTDATPLICTLNGGRLEGEGLLRIIKRLSAKSGIFFTPHALRRTFVILSLRSGLDVLHLQALLGHSSLTMVMWYAQMQDCDLIEAHAAHSPVDSLSRLK